MVTNPEERRRRRHLDAGRSVLEHPEPGEGGPALALSHVRLPDVATNEGVRNGAVYHYWRSHLEFWDELLEMLRVEGRLTDGIRCATSRCGSIGHRPSPREVWALGDAMYTSITRDDVLPVALATLAYEPDDACRPALELAADLATSRIEGFLQRTLPAVGLTVRPTGDLRRLSTSLLALLIGMAVQHHAAGDDVPGPELLPTGNVSLYAAAASALILESCDVMADTDDLLERLDPTPRRS